MVQARLVDEALVNGSAEKLDGRRTPMPRAFGPLESWLLLRPMPVMAGEMLKDGTAFSKALQIMLTTPRTSEGRKCMPLCTLTANVNNPIDDREEIQTFWREAGYFCSVLAFIQYKYVFFPSGSTRSPACLTATGLSSRA